MSVQEIEAAISRLPSNEVAELVAWLTDYHQRMWDQQIEDDLKTGRFDAVLAEVDKEFAAGLAKPL